MQIDVEQSKREIVAGQRHVAELREKIDKVDHEPDLDSYRRRDELARITNGYSPSMIEQCCSMALTIAHTEGRPEFAWGDKASENFGNAGVSVAPRNTTGAVTPHLLRQLLEGAADVARNANVSGPIVGEVAL